MRSDAMITVTCDKCHDELQVELTALACSGWDDRNVTRFLKSEGWQCEDGQDLCADCAEPDTEDEDEDEQ